MANPKKIRNGMLVLILCLGCVDFILPDFIGNEVNFRAQIGFDVILLAIISIIGIKVAIRLNLPVFLRKRDWKSNFTVILLLAFGVMMNFVPYLYLSIETLQGVRFFKHMSPWGAVLLSIRAAITEEIIYRFGIFAILVWLMSKLTGEGGEQSSRTGIVICGLISSLVFTLQHQSFIWPFVMGGLLMYVYYKKGLVYAMVGHFTMDLVPFLYVAFKLSSQVMAPGLYG